MGLVLDLWQTTRTPTSDLEEVEGMVVQVGVGGPNGWDNTELIP